MDTIIGVIALAAGLLVQSDKLDSPEIRALYCEYRGREGYAIV